ncbi:MAG TPA: tetratricopeptide repeat protein [Burkholderiales bacterium]|nr:tetratricopeptide repeat protein [Burkholderiales bacterium]
MSVATRAEDFAQRAARLYARGAVEEAAALCERALRSAPTAWKPLLLLGLMRREQGDLARAEPLLDRAREANSRNADIAFHLGCVQADLGRFDKAEGHLRAAMSLQPTNWLPCFRLGLLLEAKGDPLGALEAYQQAVERNGKAAEALNNLGNVYRKLQRPREALQAFARAIEVNPACAAAYLNRGLALSEDPAQQHAALEALRTAVHLAPANGRAHFHLGVFLDQRLRPREAREAYERALACDPSDAEALNNLGVLHLNAADQDQAVSCFERAVAMQPRLAEAWNNLGNVRIRQERWDDAKHAFETALELRPQFTVAWAALGSVLNEQGHLIAAQRCYERALALEPDSPQVLAALGNVMQRQGLLDDARERYRRAFELCREDALRIKMALMLSPIMLDDADIDAQRARVSREVRALLDSDVHASEEDLLRYPDTCFFLAYHGRSDKAPLAEIAKLMLKACPQLAYTAPHTLEPRLGTAKIRIGFVSRFFHAHSVGLFFNPIIADLAARPDFDVVLFPIGEKSDETLRALEQSVAKRVAIPATSLSYARRLIERERIDILVYPEIGMDAFTWLLSFARLGRKQCVLQGHSSTSGVPAIDTYISSALIEAPDAQSQYVEQLALLPTLPMYLEPPILPAQSASREQFSLPSQGTLYLCPMKLQKIHPQMDEAFREILQRDRSATLVLVQDHGNASWDSALRTRLVHHLGVVMSRVAFIQWQSKREDFLALVSVCDVVLDSLHHGGATTSHLALAMGKPMVTLPSGKACTRFLPAYYRLLGIHECTASSVDEYVKIAVALGTDPHRRATLSARIRANIDRLYDNASTFDAYARLLRVLALDDGEPREPQPPYIPLISVETWCKQERGRYEVLVGPREASVGTPAIAGSRGCTERSAVTLPECYLAEVSEVDVSGGENLLVANEGRAVLYDTALRYPDSRVDITAGAVVHRCGDVVLLRATKTAEQGIPCGIHLLGRGATNYYHWLLEYLPRLQALETRSEYADWPLLVDGKLHPNLLEALSRVCPNREIISIDADVRWRVHRLLVLGPRVWMPVDYRDGATVYPDDILFAPEAVDFLKRRLAGGLTSETARRRLYLRRGAAGYRRLLNEAEIEALFVEEGFDIVEPEKLSLDEQIRLFAQAEAIAGPTGAAFANMVFAPPGCRILVMYYPGVPYFYFSTLADVLGHELVYVLGEAVPGSHPVRYQRDFSMKPAEVSVALRTLLHAARNTKREKESGRRDWLADGEPIAFLAHIPEIINHYRSIWAQLPAGRVEVVNAGMGEDALEIERFARQANVRSRSIADCLKDRPYACMVSNHPVDPSGDPLIKRLAHVNVRLMYALGKAGWNLREWNALYDAILCFGPYQAEALQQVTSAALIQVGYPRFDPFFRQREDKYELCRRYRCDPARPTLVWLPTWHALSSVSLHAHAVAGLRERYNIVVKLHPLASQDGLDSARVLREAGIDHVITDSSDNLPLYRLAEYLLCDYGGPAFGGLYTDRPLLLLNVPDAASNPLMGPDSPDIVIRQVVANVDPSSSEAIARILADEQHWAAQERVRRELRRAFFAPYYGFASEVAAGALRNIARLTELDERQQW